MKKVGASFLASLICFRGPGKPDSGPSNYPRSAVPFLRAPAGRARGRGEGKLNVKYLFPCPRYRCRWNCNRRRSRLIVQLGEILHAETARAGEREGERDPDANALLLRIARQRALLLPRAFAMQLATGPHGNSALRN